MMETPNKKFVPMLLLVITLILSLLFGLIWLWKHKLGWVAVWLYYAYALIFVMVIGLIIGAVFWLFKTQRLDMIHVHKQRIISACKMNKPSFKQTIMFRGNDELEGRVIGEVLGIAMTKSIPVDIKEDKIHELKEQGVSDKEIKEFRKPKNMYWIAFKRSVINPIEIFCGIKSDFTHLSGSIIYLNGMAFSPPLYDIYFLAQRWQQTELIDETMTFTIRRYVLQEFLKEEKNLFDDTLAISPSHQKALEQSRMKTIQQDLSAPQQPKG